MKNALFVFLIALAGCATQPPNGKYNFDRFSAELPQLLETDALTVMVRGSAIDMGSYVCNRVPPPIASQVAQEAVQWKVRNENFTRAAGSAINEFASRIEAARGPEAKQSYLTQSLQTNARESSAMVARQFNGPSPDNALVPSPEACIRMAEFVRSGGADIKNNPEITRALREYMAKRGMR
jgi:hypothetical protein